MSRSPNNEDIEKLVILAKERNRVGNRLIEVEAFIKEKENLMQQWHMINRDMLKAIEEMDCAAKGNMGWEGRITHMLAELVKQAEGSIMSLEAWGDCDPAADQPMEDEGVINDGPLKGHRYLCHVFDCDGIGCTLPFDHCNCGYGTGEVPDEYDPLPDDVI